MKENAVSKKQLIKSGFWYTVSNFLTRATVFITMPIFTRLMSKEEYGNFSAFASWQAILLIICGIEVYSTLNRARFDFTEKELDGYITSALFLSTVFTGCLFLLYMIFPGFFGRLFLLNRRYILLMFAYLLTCPAFYMFQAKQRINYQYRLSAAITFFLTIASALAAMILASAMSADRLLGRIVGQYGLVILAGLCFYIYFICCSRTVTIKSIKYAARIGVPLVFSYIGSEVMLSSDVLVVKNLCSAEKVSYLSVTHTTSHIMLILVQTLNTAWAPWFYDMLRTGDTKEIRKTYLIYLWGAVICTFAVLLIGPEIILILGGAEYEESIYLLPTVIFCGIFSVLTAQFGSLETYHRKPEYAAVLTGIISVLNVMLNILGVKLWGYQAVCYTTVFCQILLVGLHYMVTLGMGIKELLPFKQLILALCATVALIPVTLLLYQSERIRYISIAACCILGSYIIIRYRKELFRIIRSLQ